MSCLGLHFLVWILHDARGPDGVGKLAVYHASLGLRFAVEAAAPVWVYGVQVQFVASEQVEFVADHVAPPDAVTSLIALIKSQAFVPALSDSVALVAVVERRLIVFPDVPVQVRLVIVFVVLAVRRMFDSGSKVTSPHVLPAEIVTVPAEAPPLIRRSLYV
jgi:hypothetical protein